MIPHILILLFLGTTLLILVRKRLIQVELVVPALLAVFVLAILSMSPVFVDTIGIILEIGYAPIGVLFIIIFLIFWTIVVLAMAMTRLRTRQIALIQHIALKEIADLEALADGHAKTPVDP
jgi:hypothetical protein